MRVIDISHRRDNSDLMEDSQVCSFLSLFS